jgi:hypothetical protein
LLILTGARRHLRFQLAGEIARLSADFIEFAHEFA